MSVGRVNQLESHANRDELIEHGYTIVPGVFGPDWLKVFGDWTLDYFEQQPIDRRYRFQGSAIRVYSPDRWEREDAAVKNHPELKSRILPDPIADRFFRDPSFQAACELLQFEGLQSEGKLIVLSKPAHGPPLYWHQDFSNWNSPEAATPWPTMVFLSTYLTDTSKANGCLRVIPGSHRRRVDLHDVLPDAHGQDVQALEDLNTPVFADHPDAVDIPMKAGDLIAADARLLHAAHPNSTDERRTLVLAWHKVFPFPEPPSWWTRPIPDVVQGADPTVEYEPRRAPTEYLR